MFLGVLVPGGFGTRGIEGKIAAAKWARENKKPYLGICLGESESLKVVVQNTKQLQWLQILGYILGI